MKHVKEVSQRRSTPARAESLLVKETELGILASQVSVIASLVSSVLTAVVALQEFSDLITKQDRHDN